MVQYRSSGRWVLPDELVQFMTNLPRTIEGSKIWPLSRVIRYWWSMLALKMEADAEDDHHGYGIQKLPEFIIESFLLRTEHRQEAEIQMYHLMVSLREYVLVKKNAFLHTFARFLGTLDAPSLESNSLEEDDGSTKRVGPKGLLNQKGLIRTTSSSLSTGILTVYMFTRSLGFHLPLILFSETVFFYLIVENMPTQSSFQSKIQRLFKRIKVFSSHLSMMMTNKLIGSYTFQITSALSKNFKCGFLSTVLFS
jgi:hypothetical protein